MNIRTKPVGDKDSYHTPEWFYRALDTEFAFDLDPCPYDPLWSPERVASGESIDGLKLDWNHHRVFCNPPWSKILPWVEKAYQSAALVVFLMPARTATKWFHIFLDQKAEMRFLKKRVVFERDDDKPVRPSGEGLLVGVVRRLHWDTVPNALFGHSEEKQ